MPMSIYWYDLYFKSPLNVEFNFLMLKRVLIAPTMFFHQKRCKVSKCLYKGRNSLQGKIMKPQEDACKHYVAVQTVST